MSDVAIRVSDLGKQYHIGKLQDHRYRTLRDTIMDALTAPYHRARRILSGQGGSAMEAGEHIWALKDVSFEVERGEVVGLIGRNGAGKTTLLKLLSRITQPTCGYAEIRGRVGSLLEVGTGFHPELTGRENIFLNGAILGMTRQEIERKFDEIVAFAEVERFIDTPVKHFSSGMYLRLAFAVAAHLEPEILLVDEVLAVGDAEFQKKCLNKMDDVGQQGRTIIFISHNMPAISRLCDRTILLENGTIAMDGPSNRVVTAYLDSGLGTTAERAWSEVGKAPAGPVARLRAVRVCTLEDGVTDVVDISQEVHLEMEYEVLQSGHVLLPHFHVFNQDGTHVFPTLEMDEEWRQRPRPKGFYRSRVKIPGNFLAEGMFFVHSNCRSFTDDSEQFRVPDAVAFRVTDPATGETARGDWNRDLGGVVRPLLEWETEYHPSGAEAAVR